LFRAFDVTARNLLEPSIMNKRALYLERWRQCRKRKLETIYDRKSKWSKRNSCQRTFALIL